LPEATLAIAFEIVRFIMVHVVTGVLLVVNVCLGWHNAFRFVEEVVFEHDEDVDEDDDEDESEDGD
jgi:hypothetical protein